MVIINSTPGVKKKYVDTQITTLQTAVKGKIDSLISVTTDPIVVTKTTTDGWSSYALTLKTVFESAKSSTADTDMGLQKVPVLTVDTYGRVTGFTEKSIASTVPSAFTDSTKADGTTAATLRAVWADVNGMPQWTGVAHTKAGITVNSDSIVTGSAVYDYVSTTVSTAYKVMGSKKASELPTTGQSVGDVYNISEAGEVSILGTATYVPEGSNVVWTTSGWDKLSATVNLSEYAKITEVNTAIGTINDDLNDLIDDVDAMYSVKEDRHVRGSITIPKIENGAATGYTAASADGTAPAKFEITVATDDITDGPYKYSVGSNGATPVAGSFTLNFDSCKALVDKTKDIFLTFSDIDVAYEAGLTVTDVTAGKFTIQVDYPECLTSDVALSFVVLSGSVNTHDGIVGTGDDAAHKHPDTQNVGTRTENNVA